ncbi:hypothetical protein H7X87_02805 [Acetobacteraceae bacterium]|nr:hypothetical protein [Candidatus Parcubacteria bacterium]
MKHIRALTYTLGGLVWVLLPFLAKAQGIVPCGQSTGADPSRGGVDVGAIGCNLCHVGELFQNLINFLVGVSIPVALIMFGVAGWIMFTSGSNPERHKKGKKVFQSVFIGFIVVVSGWLIVQTILSVLVRDEFIISDWRSLNCDATDATRIDQATGEWSAVFDNVLGTVPTGGTSITGTPNCTNGTYNEAKRGCVDANGQIIDVPTYGGGGRGTGDCSAAAFRAAGASPQSAPVYSCLSSHENAACDPTVCGDNGFSCGPLQINITVHQVVCNGANYDCPSAFDSRYTGSHHDVKTEDKVLADKCRQLLQDPACYVQTANRIVDAKKGYGDWSTHDMCGV